MTFMAIPLSQRMDFEAIRMANPLPSVAGGVVVLKRAGAEWKALCPFHSEKTPSFTIYNDGRRFMCFGCGAKGDVFDFVSLLHNVGLRDAAMMLSQGAIVTTEIAPSPSANNKSDRIDEARGVWSAALPAIGTPVEAYLRWRGISIQIPQTIRFAQLQYGRTGRVFPCLVAAVTSPDNKLCGIQRTYLADDGRGKADVPKPKLSLGRVSCGAIRLAPVSRKLVVTEGLEDGLSLMEAVGLSVWVACGATMLPQMRFPECVQNVAIGGDNDEAGRAKAAQAAIAFSERGHGVTTFFPNTPHKDFNEELKETRS